MTKHTIERETALDALSALAEADAFIRKKYGSTNRFRTETMLKMERQLGVVVKVTETDT